MRSTYTLINIHDQDHDKVGYRAVDLARTARGHYPVPLCFVVSCELFDEFLAQSGIRDRIASIYERHSQTIDGFTRAYRELRPLFQQVSFSQSLKEELIEAYASLAIPSQDAGATDLVSSDEEPAVTLIPSFTYLMQPERLDGIKQNIVGTGAFLDAIKDCWLASFLPELVLERQHFIIEKYSMGIIVQQQLSGDTAEGYYHGRSEHPIRVHSYYGMLDPSGEITRNEHLIAKEHLKVVQGVIRQQQFCLIPGEQSGVIEQLFLQERGSQQVLSERQVLEVARLTKRVHILLEKDVRLFCSVRGERVIILFALRQKADPIEQVLKESPAPAPAADDGYVPVEQAFSQEALEENPAPSVQVVDEEPVVMVEEALQEPVSEDVEERPVEVYDDAPAAVSAPVEEETLFDLFQQQEKPLSSPPGASLGSVAFVDEVVAELEEAMERSYAELYGRHSRDIAELVASLEDSGCLPVSRSDIDSLLAAHAHSQESMEVSDAQLGLAWRVRSRLRESPT